MPDEPLPASSLDARLAEIDRRLSSIQNELRPEEPAEGTAPRDELRRLAEAHERALHELLAAYDRALAVAGRTVVDVEAGPFSSTDGLRRFEQALTRLPEVREVRVRSFEGSDRVVFEVRLGRPSS